MVASDIEVLLWLGVCSGGDEGERRDKGVGRCGWLESWNIQWTGLWSDCESGGFKLSVEVLGLFWNALLLNPTTETCGTQTYFKVSRQLWEEATFIVVLASVLKIITGQLAAALLLALWFLIIALMLV